MKIIFATLISCTCFASAAYGQERHSEYPFEAGEYSVAGFRHAVGPDTGAFVMKRPPAKNDTVWGGAKSGLRPDMGALLEKRLREKSVKPKGSPSRFNQVVNRSNSDVAHYAPVVDAAGIDSKVSSDNQKMHYGARAAVLFFDVGSSTPNNADAIRPLAISPGDTIILRARTDSSGSRSANKSLAAKRAATVAQMLSQMHQVDPTQIKNEVLGVNSPVAGNSTDQGRSFNRTVIIYIR